MRLSKAFLPCFQTPSVGVGEIQRYPSVGPAGRPLRQMLWGVNWLLPVQLIQNLPGRFHPGIAVELSLPETSSWNRQNPAFSLAVPGGTVADCRLFHDDDAGGGQKVSTSS